MKNLFAILLTIVSFSSFSQSYTIQVLDSVTHEAIEMAHVIFENPTTKEQHFEVTNAEGKAPNKSTLVSTLSITYIGYKTKTISIEPNTSKTILLEKYTFDLDEVVVTGQFSRILKKDAIYSINSIDLEKIEKRGANNLATSLNQELSITVNNGQANESAIMLNGLSGAYVKILIDGVPVEGQLNGGIDLSQIMTTDIEKIEILEGPATIEYGTDAIAGAINIITKKNQSKKIRVGADLLYESVGQYNVAANIGLKLKENYISIKGGRNFFDGFSVKDTSRFKEWKPKEQYFAEASYSRKIKTMKLFYSFNFFNELMTSKGELRAPYYISAFDTYYKTTRVNNKIIFSGAIQKHHHIDISLAQSHYNRRRNIYFKDLTTLNQILSPSENDQDTTIFNNYLARAVYNLKKENSMFQYLAGTAFKYDEIIANRVKNNRQFLIDFSVFSNVQIKPTEKLTIQPALRYGYNTKYKYPFLPSLSLKYEVNKNIDLRATYSRGFRAPSLKELYLEFHYNSTINLYGSENLEAENSHHFLVSSDIRIPFEDHFFRIQPKFFYNRINNMISLINISDIDWQYGNVGNFDVLGFELRTSYKYKALSLDLNYQLLGQKNNLYQEVIFKDKFHLSSQFGANINIAVQKPALNFGIEYKYIGRKTGIYLTDNQEIKNSSLAAYQILDISVRKKFFKDMFSITAGVKNLLNYNQIDLDGDLFGISAGKDAENLNVLWGRTFFTSLKFNW